ncbi:Nucleoid occlusion protein [subsurface metagenome]
MEIKQIKINKIKPNDYNPNKMTEEKYKELVNEIKHLGKIPKPLIIDVSNTIIDGEHTYRAAKELNYKELPCEVVDVDDFEKRRMTFKYNQHGEHNQVLLGKMFKQMLDMQNISQQELAMQMDITEGTIKNALLYLRVQGEVDRTEADRFTVKQIKMWKYFCDKINPLFANVWLRSGGKKTDLIDCLSYCFKGYKIKGNVESSIENSEYREGGIKEAVVDFFDLNELYWKGIKEEHVTFHMLYRYVLDRIFFVRKIKEESFGYCCWIPKAINGYFSIYFDKVWPLDGEYCFVETLKFLLTPESKFLLTPEELREAAKEAKEYISLGKKGISYKEFEEDFLTRKIVKKYGEFKPKRFYDTEKEIVKNRLREAPDYIQNANYYYNFGAIKGEKTPDYKSRYELWKMDLEEEVKKIVAKIGVRPGNERWDVEIYQIRKHLTEQEIFKEFKSLTAEQTIKEVVKYLKKVCSKFKLSEEDKSYLENGLEVDISDFLKKCKIGPVVSYVFYTIAKEKNWREALTNRFKMIRKLEGSLK